MAAAFGAIGVITGAFGAHALEGRISVDRMQTWQTAVLYQFIHAFLLLSLGILGAFLNMYGMEIGLLKWAGFTAIGGIVVFSGSLYALCLSGIRWLGAITPIGGVLFIAAWFLLALGVMLLIR